jgi:hypothetical protein
MTETRVVQMRYPVDLLDAIRDECRRRGQTRTELVLDAVRARLGLADYTVEVDETDGAHNAAPPAAPPDSVAGARARTRQVSPRFKKT